VLIIFAGANKFLDDIEVSECGRFEAGAVSLHRNELQRPAETLREKKAFDDTNRRAERKRRSTLSKSASSHHRQGRGLRLAAQAKYSRSMPTLLDYRRRIRSVKSTQQITRAMKFVAAAKLRRAQEGVFAARPYAGNSSRAAFGGRTHGISGASAARTRPEEKILVVVLTGDRSLAGAFNSNVLRRATEFIREHHAQKLELIVVGKKGRDTLRKRGFSFVARISGRLRESRVFQSQGNRGPSRRALHQRRSGCGLRHLQRVQKRDGAESARRKTAARRS
jgi:hypothetical protein